MGLVIPEIGPIALILGWKSDSQCVDYLEKLGEYQMLPREILGIWELCGVLG